MFLTTFLGTLFLTASPSIAPTANPHWQAAFERNGDIYISNADGSHLLRLVKKGVAPRWSPDGKRFLFQRDNHVMVFEMATRTERKIYDYDPKEERTWWDLAGYGWDPLRPAILIAKPHGEDLALVPYGGTGVPPSADILGGRLLHGRTYAPAWSPSGRFLAFGKQGDIWIARRETPDPKHLSILSKEASGNLISRNGYYEEANRLAPLATFNEAEIGASLVTPFWVDEIAWTRNEKRIVFHYQRISGTGVSDVGYLDLTPTEPDVHNGLSAFSYVVHWILNDVISPRICPDGKTLSYVKAWRAEGALMLSDWTGKHSRKLMANIMNPDWRPIPYDH